MSEASRESVPAVDGPVLGIETSCDETAAAVIAGDDLLSNVVFSQTEHSLYGGVVPELASRNHVRKILPVIQQALQEAGVEVGDLAGIAPTCGPGLVGCLLVGISTAKGLAMATGVDLVGVHHIEGHLFAGQLACPGLRTPFLTLVASGGHTDLVRVGPWGDYTIRGRTRDDAAGEAFDKVAKLMGLLREGETTMGGPRISALAEKGNPVAFDFPRAFEHAEGYEFSFSGLKTSVLYKLRDMSETEKTARAADIAASFQKAVVDVLVSKTIRAARDDGVPQVLLTGGVAANQLLRDEMTAAAALDGVSVFYPPPALCTDNAAMIARAGSFRLATGPPAGLDLNANPRLGLC